MTIVLDQLRADAFGAAGQRFAPTPNLDRLAADSVWFTTCVTDAPLCRPARVSLMSGQPVWQHGCTSNHRVPAPEAVPSHVRRLRDEAGYHTAVVGKTHLHDGTGHLDEHRPVLARWGFTDAVELPDAMMTHLRSAHSDALGPEAYQRWRAYATEHRLVGPPPDDPPWALPEALHLDLFCAELAAARIRDHRGPAPLYLQVSFPGPHPPFDPPRRFVTRGPDDPTLPAPIPDRSTGPRSELAARVRRSQRLDPAAIRCVRAAYFAKVSVIDEAIGRVVAALADTDWADRAWVVVTADHGELLGDHGLVGKVLAYEGALRVPLLVRPPGGIAGRADVAPVSLVDVTATVLEIARLPHDRPGLLSRLRRPPTEDELQRSVPFQCLGRVGLRHPRWTVVWDRRRRGAGPVELFDREADPEQHHNAVRDPGAAEVAAALAAMLPPAAGVDTAAGSPEVP